MLLNPKLKIYEFNIEPTLTPTDRKLIYEYLASQNNEIKKINPGLTNFEILQYKDYFDNLYDQFLEISFCLFGDLTIVNPNKKCWAYVTSRNDKKSNLWHDHSRTSTVNGVFYFSVPDESSGKLLFGDHDLNVISDYQPKENTMLVFPNSLMHCPTHCDSDEYRIAINMELSCLEDAWK